MLELENLKENGKGKVYIIVILCIVSQTKFTFSVNDADYWKQC